MFGRPLVLSLAMMVVGACGPAPDDGDDDDDVLGGAFALASIVTIVNPIVNQGSNVDVVIGPERANVSVTLDSTTPAITTATDPTGLALVQPVRAGSHTLSFPGGQVAIDIPEDDELHDVVVAVRSDGAEYVVPPIRYPVASGNVVVVAPGESIAEAAQEDGAILVLEPGVHTGGFEITAADVLLFGAPSDLADLQSIVDGDITWRGGGGRMRGLQVTGTLTANANSFSAAFCDLGAANITGNDDTLIRNLFSDGAVVPSSNAVLVDNVGIP